MSRSKLVDRKQTYRITATRGRSEFVGQRCRLMVVEDLQEITLQDDGFAHDLEGYMLSGKFFNSVVSLPPCKFKPVSSLRCNCGAYKFSHAPGLGECKRSAKEEIAADGVDLDSLFAKVTP